MKGNIFGGLSLFFGSISVVSALSIAGFFFAWIFGGLAMIFGGFSKSKDEYAEWGIILGLMGFLGGFLGFWILSEAFRT
jgi:preprotein translocase subunit SecG